MNLNGEKEEASGKIVIHRLEFPKIVYSSRSWQQPDKFVLPEVEFRKNFPFNLYKNENDHTKWNKKAEVFSAQFNTANNDSIEIKDLKKWPAGKYFLELTSKDKFGAEIKSTRYFDVFGKETKKFRPMLPFGISATSFSLSQEKLPRLS